jgi:hypothetical protein
MKNVPIPQLEQWLGHSTINMTMRYAHLAPSHGAELDSDPNGIRTAGQSFQENPGATRPCDGFPRNCQQFGPLSSFRGRPC